MTNLEKQYMEKLKELLKLQRKYITYEVSGEGDEMDFGTEYLPSAIIIEKQLASLEQQIEQEEKTDEAKLKEIEITDADIIKWAIPFKFKSNHIWDERSLIEGAKAMRDGLIKHQ